MTPAWRDADPRPGYDAIIIGGGGKRRLTCDAILTSDGWNPAVHLHSQSGGSLAYDDGLQAFLPAKDVQDAVSVGAVAGIFDAATAEEVQARSGRRAPG